MNENTAPILPATDATPLPPVQTPRPVKKPGEYRLFKRDTNGRTLSPDSPEWRERTYSFKFNFRGKVFLRNLSTADKAQAQTYARLLAREIKEAVVREDVQRLDATRTRRQHVATLEELEAAYKIAPVEAGARTRTHNLGSLRIILKKMSLPANPDVAQINGELARRFFTAAGLEVQSAAGNQAEQIAIKRRANTLFNRARCLFAPRAVAHYQSLGIDHPAMEEFSKAYTALRFNRLPPINYNPPAEEIIDTTIRAWEQLEDRNLFLAIGHELAFGLRISEVAQAKWGWWTVRQGYPCLDGVASVKGGTGLVQVRALDPYFHILRAKIAAREWRADNDDYIITGSAAQRTDAIFRAVTNWMRQFGWQTNKTNHSLRAYVGSQVAMKYGIYEAQIFLRHSTVKVTEHHYTHFVTKFKPANPDDLPFRWATAASLEPVLRVFQGGVNG